MCRLLVVSHSATLEDMKGTSYDLKDTLVHHAENVPNVVLITPFEKAGTGYQELWRWIVMSVLPIVSSKWKSRVEAGPHGKLMSGGFWECVTTGDVAFVYVLLRWGMRKWVVGNELTNHRIKEHGIKKKMLKIVSVKMEDENSDDKETVHNYAELDEDVKMGAVSTSEDWDEGDESGDAGSPSGDEEENGAEEENSPKARGRRKGEEGFGCFDNVKRYNQFGMMVEDILDSKAKDPIANTWIIQAMKWVNKEIVVVDSDSDGEGNDYGKNKKSEKLAPFVPRDRSKPN